VLLSLRKVLVHKDQFTTPCPGPNQSPYPMYLKVLVLGNITDIYFSISDKLLTTQKHRYYYIEYHSLYSDKNKILIWYTGHWSSTTATCIILFRTLLATDIQHCHCYGTLRHNITDGWILIFYWTPNLNVWNLRARSGYLPDWIFHMYIVYGSLNNLCTKKLQKMFRKLGFLVTDICTIHNLYTLQYDECTTINF